MNSGRRERNKVLDQVSEFVRDVQSGNKEAWESLLRNVYPSALSQAKMLLRDQDLAEDALQNALIKVFKFLPTLETPEAFKAWFRRVLMNEVYLILRIRQKETEGLNAELLVDQCAAPDERVTLKVELFRVLQMLPFEQQQVFIEVDVWGKSLNDTAKEYGLPLGTVKSRLFRARERLRKELRDWLGAETVKNRCALENNDDKESWIVSTEQNNWPTRDQFYDYLEGTMPSEERADFEKQWSNNSEWSKELSRHKNFLTLLHSLTGRLTLSSQEIAEKAQKLNDQIQNYEMVQEQTYFKETGPSTNSSHIWFKRPGQLRIESSNPMVDETITTIRGQEMLCWTKSSQKARRLKFSQEISKQMGPDYLDALKKLAADKNCKVLGTEYVEGRPALHIQFMEKVDNMKDMNTHVWLDKVSWMLLVTERYNSEGKLILRTLVKELKLNQGIPDFYFELEIPEGVKIDEEESEEIHPFIEISLEEASRRLSCPMYYFQTKNLSVKHQWVHFSDKQEAVVSLYKKKGEPIAYLTLTQGKTPQTNNPSQESGEVMYFTFEGSEVKGVFREFNFGSVMNMITWEYQGQYFSASCNGSKEELMDNIKELHCDN